MVSPFSVGFGVGFVLRLQRGLTGSGRDQGGGCWGPGRGRGKVRGPHPDCTPNPAPPRCAAYPLSPLNR